MIEEAAAVLRNYGYGHLTDAVEAVFEKALGEATVTPTAAEGIADEREALIRIYERCWESWNIEALPRVEEHNTFSSYLAAEIAHAGFRHSGVPEPTAEDVEVTLTFEAVESNRKYIERTQGEPSDAGVGWFEWFKMPENTTEIAYVHENGEVFDPARGWNPVDFTIAAAEGHVYRLVRAAGGVR